MRRTDSTTTCCALPTASATRLKVRSMVGLLPLCATTVVEPWQRERVPQSGGITLQSASKQMPGAAEGIHPTGPGHFGVGERGIIALVNPERLRRILTKMLDENEFLSPYGIRSLSKLSRRASLSSSRSAARNTGSIICPANRTAACLAATRTGAGRSGSR